MLPDAGTDEGLMPEAPLVPLWWRSVHRVTTAPPPLSPILFLNTAQRGTHPPDQTWQALAELTLLSCTLCGLHSIRTILCARARVLAVAVAVVGWCGLFSYVSCKHPSSELGEDTMQLSSLMLAVINSCPLCYGEEYCNTNIISPL